MILSVSNLTKTYGERTLFEGASFSVEKGERIGLIGANGAGKTTLFNILCGREEADSGDIAVSPYTTIGYLEQYVCSDSDKSTYDETLSVHEKLFALERELAALQASLKDAAADGDPSRELILKQDELQEQYRDLGGLTYKAETRSVLLGLGFAEEELALPVKSLSGGQKSKIGLAKLLLQKPDLMLLDEPTNHLDIKSVSWLEKFVAGSGITTIVISHDRYFLDKVCTKMMEIRTRKLYVTGGNYTRHMELSAERDLSEERHYRNIMNEVHRLEGVIAQQRRWNRQKNIKTAESKQKQIDRMTAGLEKPEHERHDFRFSFQPKIQSGDEVLELRDVRKEFPERVLYENVNFEIRRGQCVFLLGENGIGKTTLIKQIIRKGRGVRYGVGVTTGYFDQHQLNLTLSKTVFEEIHDRYPDMTDTDVRSSLAVFGFKGEKVFAPVAELSGGERAKVALCRLMLEQCNFLVLDEPTNHLDIYSLAALEDALRGYEGTMLIISHDRYFINELADKVMDLRPDGVRVYEGGFDEYQEALDREAKEAAVAGAGKPEKELGKGGQQYENKKKLRSERTKARTAVTRKEEEISALETRIEDLTAQLDDPAISADYEKISALSAELADANEQLETAMAEWEELSETLNELL